MDRKLAKRLLEEHAHQAPGALFLCNPDGRVEFAGGSALELLPISGEECVGKPLSEILTSGDGNFIQRAHEAALNGDAWSVRGQRGQIEVAIQIRPAPQEGADGEPAGTVAVAVPLGEGLEAGDMEQAILERGNPGERDPVTGTLTRMGLRHHAQTLIDKDPGIPRAALRIRVDGLRRINHAFGQDMGDKALRRIALRFKSALDPSEEIARVSGNEFIILASRESPERTQMLFSHLEQLFEEPVAIDGHEFMFRLQGGTALYPEDAVNAPELGRRATVALEQARSEGVSHAFFSAEGEERLAAQGWVPGAVKRALRREEFELNFHPILGQDGKVAWMEALLRWRHPRRGWVSPGVFIPIAEGMALMQDIDYWVLERACREAKEVGLPVAVNITPDTLAAPDFLTRLDDVLDRTGLPAQWLTIEITERVFSQPETTQPLLEAIRNRDILVAVDDFGVGYSALSYLWQYPVDELKLDGSFVRSSRENERAKSVVEGIVTMARRMDMKVVAEQVEDASDREWLTRIGVPYLQGFHFCKPMAKEELRDWLLAGERQVKVD